ncbi:hypothetical protein CC1G_01235 [Coprinopsis cinerea okayama7|uniref:Uncharacterized protein n=1 Tax=Coprinopsis cinerea (strain Okayama-7 / 130 / ATCC MYA-4618 / FGSC 9003) TaxID=240176 RepID=A8NEZ6_COPC7|nr:hypothetical protein CC1G_01235 [Coprinopsis cinerea okayama7\|eukprot:XP_001833173.2 hypothetical protein CC1G_01235 [Coprinopsis cinerea okayama7\
MSAIRHFIGALPAGRRSYSSFFSSKPGGGRYFNSAKAKSAVVAAKSSSKADSKPKDTSSTSTATTTANPNATNQDGMDSSANPTTRTVADAQVSSLPVTAAGRPPLSSSPSPPTGASSSEVEVKQQFVEPVEHSMHIHPVMSSKDFKLHQFFALHRPLLLLNNSPSLFTSGPSLESILSTSGQVQPRQESETQAQQPLSVFDDFPADASIDADAEAARQLARGLTLNKAGPAVAWEDTLKRLGLDPSRDPERVTMQEQMDKDWEDVQILLDSTKRKRRKKMKKHK